MPNIYDAINKTNIEIVAIFIFVSPFGHRVGIMNFIKSKVVKLF